jgi:4-hydroxy-3-polyprenylbenzoate decarboxylase
VHHAAEIADLSPTIVGIPPMEDYYLGLASERIFLPLIRKTVPEIVDMHFPAEGIFHNLVIISIDKRTRATPARS